MAGFFIENDDILHAPGFFHVGAHDHIGVTLEHAHEPFRRREGETVIFVFLAFEIALVGKTSLGELLEKGGLVDIFSDVAPASHEQAGDGAALHAENQDAAFLGPIDEAIESCEPLFLRKVSE